MDRDLKNEESTQISLMKADVLNIMVEAEVDNSNTLLLDILDTRMGTEHLGEIIEQIMTLLSQPCPSRVRAISILQVKLAVQKALLQYKLNGSQPEVLRLIPDRLETCGVIEVLQKFKDMIDTHNGKEEGNHVRDRGSTNNAAVVSLNHERGLCEPEQQRMETDTSGIDHVIQCPNVQQNNHHDHSDYETASQLVQLAQPQDSGSGTNPYRLSCSARPTGGSMLQLLNSPQTSMYFPAGLGKPHQQFDGRSEGYVAQAENRSRYNGTTTDSQAMLPVTDSDKSSSTPDSDKSYRSGTDKGDDSDCTAYRVTVEEPSIRFYENDMNIQLKLQKHSKDQVPLFSSLLNPENRVDKTTPKVEYSEFLGKGCGGETSSLIRDCIDDDNDATPSCSFIIMKPEDVNFAESDSSLEIDLEYDDDETHGKKDFSNMVAQEMEVSTSFHQSDQDPQRLRRCKEDQDGQDVPLLEADINSLPEADMSRVQQQSLVHSNRRHSNWFITHRCRFCKDLSSADFKHSENVRQLPKSTRLDKIRHHISTLKPKVKRGSPQRKSISNVFQIPFSGGQAHRVCRDTFVKFFGICRDTVGRLSHGLPTARLDKTEHISIDGVGGVRDIDDDHKPAEMERASHIEENHGNMVAQSNQQGSSAGEDKRKSIPPDQVWAIVRNDVKNFLESRLRWLPANNNYCRKKYVYYMDDFDDIVKEYELECGGPVHEGLVAEVADSIGFKFIDDLLDKQYGPDKNCSICRILEQKGEQEMNGDRWQQQLYQHQQSAERVTSYCQRVRQGGEGDPGELVLYLNLMDCTMEVLLPQVIGVAMYDMKRSNQSYFMWEYIRAGFGTQELLSCLLCYLKRHLQEVRTHRLVLVTEPYGGLLRNTDFIVLGLWLMVHFHIEELHVIYKYHGHRSDVIPQPDSTEVGDVIDAFKAQSTPPLKPLHDIISDKGCREITCMTSDMMFNMSAMKKHEETVNWEEIQVSLNTTRCLHMTRHGSECVVKIEKYFSDNVVNTADSNCVTEYRLPLPPGEIEMSPLYPSSYRIPAEYNFFIGAAVPVWKEYFKTHAKVDWSETSNLITDPSAIIQETDGVDDDESDDGDEDDDNGDDDDDNSND